MAEATAKREGISAIVLVVLLILVAVYVLFYGPQTLAYIEARHWGRVNPWLYDVPQSLSPGLSTPNVKTHLEFFNYQCDAPWKGPAKMSGGAGFIQAAFPSGAVVLVFLPEAQGNALEASKGTDPAEQRRFANLFGDQQIKSNFDFYKTVYAASPALSSPFQPRVEAERIRTLLLWKLNYDQSLPGGSFTFEAGGNEVLQFGDPAKSSGVTLRAFNARDRQFKFNISAAAGSADHITQGDLYEIIASLRPIPLPGQ